MKSILRASLGLLALTFAVPALSAGAGPAVLVAEVKPGSVKLIGKYQKRRLREGKKKKTYFVVGAGERIRIRAGGPTAFSLLARGNRRMKVDFELLMDGEQNAALTLTVQKKKSRGFYVEIPAGEHEVAITVSKRVLVRPVRSRQPKPGQAVVAWQGKPSTELAVLPPLVAPEPAADPKDSLPPPVAPKTESPSVISPVKPPPPAEKTIVAATTPTPPATSAPEAVASKVKKTSMKLDLNQQRPVEIRLRMLADLLADGFRQLPGRGRYERLVVAEFAENGSAVKDINLGPLVGAQLNTFLKRDHGFFLLERARLADMLKEMEMAMTGLVDASKAAEVGKMLGAQAIVVGSVAEAGADFVINARLISAESAEVLVAESMTVPRAGMIALSDESVVLRTRSGSIFRSLLVPGWGQFYNRQPVKGGILIGTELALAGVAVAMHFLGDGDEKTYLASDFALKYPDLTSSELSEKATALRQSAEDYYQLRNVFIYSAMGVYLYGILDAYLFGIDGEHETGLGVVPMPMTDVRGQGTAGLGLGFTFQ